MRWLEFVTEKEKTCLNEDGDIRRRVGGKHLYLEELLFLINDCGGNLFAATYFTDREAIYLM